MATVITQMSNWKANRQARRAAFGQRLENIVTSGQQQHTARVQARQQGRASVAQSRAEGGYYSAPSTQARWSGIGQTAMSASGLGLAITGAVAGVPVGGLGGLGGGLSDALGTVGAVPGFSGGMFGGSSPAAPPDPGPASPPETPDKGTSPALLALLALPFLFRR